MFPNLQVTFAAKAKLVNCRQDGKNDRVLITQGNAGKNHGYIVWFNWQRHRLSRGTEKKTPKEQVLQDMGRFLLEFNFQIQSLMLLKGQCSCRECAAKIHNREHLVKTWLLWRKIVRLANHEGICSRIPVFWENILRRNDPNFRQHSACLLLLGAFCFVHHPRIKKTFIALSYLIFAEKSMKLLLKGDK